MNERQRLTFNGEEYEVLEAHDPIGEGEDIDRLAFYLVKPKPRSPEDVLASWVKTWIGNGESNLARICNDEQLRTEFLWAANTLVNLVLEFKEQQKKNELQILSNKFKDHSISLFNKNGEALK